MGAIKNFIGRFRVSAQPALLAGIQGRRRRDRSVSESAKPTRPTSTKQPITQDPHRDLGAPKHDRMLAIARHLWRQNPIAKRGVQNLRSFVASEGFRVRATAKNPEKRARVQRYLDKWWQLNRWDELLSKRVETLSVESEWWYWEAPPNQEGLSKLCAILPEEIRHVERDPLDAERMHRVALTRPLEFCVGDARHVKHHLTIIDEQNVDGEVHCLQINTLTGQTRGFSDLLVVSDWLDYLDTLTFTEIERVQFQRNFSWFVKLDSDDQTIIDNKRDELNEEGPPGAGSIKVIGNGEDWEAKSPQLNLEDSVAFIKLIMLICFGGLIMPEHYFASGGDVNKATSANMDTPVWAFTRDRKAQIRAFLSRCVIRALQNLVRAGTLVGYSTEDLAFEIVSRDPDRSAYDLIGDMLKKLGEAMTLGKNEGYVSDVEAARAYRTAASGLGLGDFPGVDQQSLDQARELVQQRMEQQREVLQQQFPTREPNSVTQEAGGEEKKNLLRDLTDIVADRSERTAQVSSRAQDFAGSITSDIAAELLKSAQTGGTLQTAHLEDVLRRYNPILREKLPAPDLRSAVDSGRDFVVRSLAGHGLEIPSGSTMSATRPWHELEEWDLYRRVAWTVVKRPKGVTGATGGRIRRFGQETAHSLAWWTGEDLQNAILAKARDAQARGETLEEFARSLGVGGDLADLTAKRVADNIMYAELRAAKFAEQLMYMDIAKANPGKLKVRFVRVRGEGKCRKCDPRHGDVFSPGDRESRKYYRLPQHPHCGCAWFPVFPDDAGDPGGDDDFLDDLGGSLTDAMEPLVPKAKPVPAPAIMASPIAHDGGIGPDPLPEPDVLIDDVLWIGGQAVPLLKMWAGTGESEVVQSAIDLFHPEYIQGLKRFEITNEVLKKGDVQSNAQYYKSVVSLSRAAGRDYRNKDLLQMRLAKITIAHEMAHHVYKTNHWARSAWAAAALADLAQARQSGNEAVVEFLEGVIMLRGESLSSVEDRRNEMFAGGLEDFLWDRGGFARDYPEISRVFARILR